MVTIGLFNALRRSFRRGPVGAFSSFGPPVRGTSGQRGSDMTVDPSGRKEEGLRRPPWAEKGPSPLPGPHAGAPPAAAEELQAALDRARQKNAELEARQQALLADLQAGPA